MGLCVFAMSCLILRCCLVWCALRCLVCLFTFVLCQVNKVGYGQCGACSEPPLGAGDDDMSSEERGREGKEMLFAEPKSEDKAYYELLKSVLIVGSTAFCSSMGGPVLQQEQFSVQAEVLFCLLFFFVVVFFHGLDVFVEAEHLESLRLLAVVHLFGLL